MDFITLFISLAATVAAVELIGLTVYGRPELLAKASLYATNGFAQVRDILNALRLWGRHLLVLAWNQYAIWRLSRQKRDINAKCPSCGHRSGHITASKQHRMLIHRCLICTVEWGEPFLLDPTIWIKDAPPGG